MVQSHSSTWDLARFPRAYFRDIRTWDGEVATPKYGIGDDHSVALERGCVDSDNGTNLSEVSSDGDARRGISAIVVEAAL